jgi:hypothetical protein
MDKTYYGLRVKKNQIDLKGEKYLHNNGLLGAAIEFLGEQVYYYADSSKYDNVWLVKTKEIAKSALLEPSEYEDDAVNYEKLFITYDNLELDDVEVVEISFSSTSLSYKVTPV